MVRCSFASCRSRASGANYSLHYPFTFQLRLLSSTLHQSEQGLIKAARLKDAKDLLEQVNQAVTSRSGHVAHGVMLPLPITFSVLSSMRKIATQAFDSKLDTRCSLLCIY